jgi:hypothetical protein
MAVSRKAPKKSSGTKKAAKKSASKKGTKATQAKTKVPQAIKKKEPAKDCICKQRTEGVGNFFCFRLIDGEWAQASDIGFPSKETCEAATCGE